jgi:hypothetical protein
MGAPPGPRGNRTGDALDYSGYDALPPPPSPPRASRPAAVESRPRSRERRPRSRSASRPRVDLKITLPVMFPDSVVNGEERSQPGEGMSRLNVVSSNVRFDFVLPVCIKARGEAHKQLKVLGRYSLLGWSLKKSSPANDVLRNSFAAWTDRKGIPHLAFPVWVSGKNRVRARIPPKDSRLAELTHVPYFLQSRCHARCRC